MANLFRCGGGGLSEEVKRVPCFMDKGNDGTTLDYENASSYIMKTATITSKVTDYTETGSISRAMSSNMCNIDFKKILDCKWIIILTGGGSTSSGQTASNYALNASATKINFDKFGLEFNYNSDTKTMLKFKPLHRIVNVLDPSTNGNLGNYVMYLAEVDKEKSSPIENFTLSNEVTNFKCYSSVTIRVSTSSYPWYNIQLIPFIESK